MKKIFLILLVAVTFTTGAVLDGAADSTENAGDVLTAVLPAGALLSSYVVGDKEGDWQLVKTLAVANGITYALKPLINEERPNGKDYSFPSGHATMAFGAAGYIQRRYGWGYGLPAYLVAGFVGYSRVESDNHYWQDIAGGALVGIGSAYFFTSPRDTVEVKPYLSKNVSGVEVKIKL